MNLRTKIVGTAAVGLAAILIASCGGKATPTPAVIDLRGQVTKLESVSGFYHITARMQDGMERTLTIDVKRWGGDERYQTLKAGLQVGEYIEVPGIRSDVVSGQMYVGPDLVHIVKNK